MRPCPPPEALPTGEPPGAATSHVAPAAATQAKQVMPALEDLTALQVCSHADVCLSEATAHTELATDNPLDNTAVLVVSHQDC